MAISYKPDSGAFEVRLRVGDGGASVVITELGEPVNSAIELRYEHAMELGDILVKISKDWTLAIGREMR